ncbi:hypothetical protein RQP46_001093 [Phenoliferia psychrophenolica]
MYNSSSFGTPQGQPGGYNQQSQSSSSSFNAYNSTQSTFAAPFGQSTNYNNTSTNTFDQQPHSPFGQSSQGGQHMGGQQLFASQPQGHGHGHGQGNGVGANGNGSGNFGDKGPKRYIVGYLSTGTLRQAQADKNTPPSHGAEDNNKRSQWDSPTHRASISGSSPIARGALFASSSTPSRPQASALANEPQAYGAEADDNGPPAVSLSELDGQDSAMSYSNAEYSSHDSRRPPLTSHASTSSLLPTSSSSSSSAPPKTYSAEIFGFPASATTKIVDLFRECGEVVASVPCDGGNWVTLSFSDPMAVRRAARKNGTVVPWQGGLLMIGVKAADEDALDRLAQFSDQAAQGQGVGAVSSGEPSRSNTPSRGTRPVNVVSEGAFKTAAPTPPRRGFFGVAAATTPGGGAQQDPHASLFKDANKLGVMKQAEGKGLLGKASDLVFGW